MKLTLALATIVPILSLPIVVENLKSNTTVSGWDDLKSNANVSLTNLEVSDNDGKLLREVPMLMAHNAATGYAGNTATSLKTRTRAFTISSGVGSAHSSYVRFGTKNLVRPGRLVTTTFRKQPVESSFPPPC